MTNLVLTLVFIGFQTNQSYSHRSAEYDEDCYLVMAQWQEPQVGIVETYDSKFCVRTTPGTPIVFNPQIGKPTAYVYVATNGNDSTAIRDNPAFPFASLTNAVLNSASGDLILVSQGVYNIGRASLDLPNNVSMKAEGEVVIQWSGDLLTNGCAIVPGDNSLIEGFTAMPLDKWNNYQAFIGTVNIQPHSVAAQKSFTNATVRGCHIIAGSDGIFCYHENVTSILVEDCFIESDWDAVALLGENQYGTVKNCTLICHGPSGVNESQPAHGVYNSEGNLKLIGGYIEVSGPMPRNAGVWGELEESVSSICGTVFNVMGDRSASLTNITGSLLKTCPGYYVPPVDNWCPYPVAAARQTSARSPSMVVGFPPMLVTDMRAPAMLAKAALTSPKGPGGSGGLALLDTNPPPFAVAVAIEPITDEHPAQLKFVCNTVTNWAYLLQCSSRVGSGQWQNVPPDEDGDGNLMEFYDPLPNHPLVYRILAKPGPANDP